MGLKATINRSIQVDTLYSIVIYDLSQNDLELTVPEIPASQYALFSFYSPYGGNYANVGSGEGLYNRSGTYRIRGPMVGSKQVGVQPLDEVANPSDPVANVYSPTTYGTLLIRWLVNATNLEAVHGYQDRTSLSTTARQDAREAPSLVSLNIDQYKNLTVAQRVLSLLAVFAPWNMPQNEAAAMALAPRLQAAGISNNVFNLPEGVDLEEANRTALASVVAAGTAPSSRRTENNGWSIVPEGLAGNFDNGTNYAFRTAIAAVGYLMLVSPLAV